MKLKLLFTLCLFGALLSCDKDNVSGDDQQNDTPSNFSEYFGNEITRSFLGNVVDSNGNPLENVTITIGTDQVQTDENGVFSFEDAQVNQRFAYVKAEKAGYIHGSRALVPTNGVNKVSIMLLAETVAGSTSSGTEKTISIPNGASVSLKGDYIKEDGTPYTGDLDVIIHHLDPTDENVVMQMPGMLYAANASNEERMLQTLGMLAVELRGAGGEDLNLGENSSAEIKIPVDASLLSMAPSTIPLWYFDEDKGYWIEEGEATLVGSNYIGSVKHFSFWNCDIPAEAINLCVTVMNGDETAFANTRVTITSTTFGTRSGYTNELGEVCGLVPSGETLEINVYDFAVCGSNVIYTSMIGPYNADDNITVVVQEDSNIINETVFGTFADCNENPITNGYVVLTYGDQTFYDSVTDGAFEINLLRCATSDSFSIEAVDTNNLQTTGAINYTFDTDATNLGNLLACDAVSEFIQYTVDDTDELLVTTNIQASFMATGGNSDNSLNISGQTESGTSKGCFYLFGTLNDAPHTGTYDTLDFQDMNDTGIFIGECISISENNNNIMYNVTALGNVGEYIDINFSGSYEDRQGNPHTITGVIHVLRD
ncbi:carboxypeptidase-like regulatory domain-containing protein [Hyunsoonleella rubra]|uniref:Carboxypeptidase-like regulatory domain-containing protein n=1 Tax=Hyunsoonleella rubra TaxID=1737062 RepID=A0ABW5T7G4_9FLAO